MANWYMTVGALPVPSDRQAYWFYLLWERRSAAICAGDGAPALLLREALTWTPPVCQVSFGKKDRLQSYIRPVDGVYPPGLYGIRRRGPI